MSVSPKIQFMPARGGGGLVLKSIQYRTVTIASGAASGTVAITAVTVANAILILLGWSTANTANGTGGGIAQITLTGSTTVTANRNGSVTGASVISFCVMEFKKLKSCQYGTVTILSTNTTGTAAITSVDLTKAILFYLGQNMETGNNVASQELIRVTLTDATTVTATLNTKGYTQVVAFVVAEMALT